MPDRMTQILWTIGHSTRPIGEFLKLLASHGIRLLVDVRSMPYSRRNPQFNTDVLSDRLSEADIKYVHMPALGGHRKSIPTSPNSGWRNTGFRGYADYMQTEPFWQGLEELMRLAETSPTAIMCAEAVPWRCHRSLIADALVSQSWTVRHILSGAEAPAHQITPFARIVNDILTYPEQTSQEPTPRLF